MDPQTKGSKEPSLGLNPIPRNMVACIGGLDSFELRYYIFWKDHQTIVIQAEPLLSREDAVDNPDLLLHDKRQDDYLVGLQYIHNLLHTIEFGKTNWAYLVPRRDGGYKIVQRERRIRRIRCPTWAPLIEEKEIIYTTWWPNDVRAGYWRGQEVEVMMGWGDRFLANIERNMIGYLLLRGLDLTYNVLAHIVEKDGTVIGVVTEPELGRLFQYRDRGLVYDAISRIQRRGLIYRAIMNPNIHILNGKVRLSTRSLAGVHHYEDPAEFDEEAAWCHWDCLEDLFASLDPNNFDPRPTWQRRWNQVPQLLPPQPSPEPLLDIQFFGFPTSKDPNKLWWKSPCDSDERNSNRHDRKRHADRRDRKSRPAVISLQLPEEMLQAIREVPHFVSRRASPLLRYSQDQTALPRRRVAKPLLIRHVDRDRE